MEFCHAQSLEEPSQGRTVPLPPSPKADFKAMPAMDSLQVLTVPILSPDSMSAETA